MNSSELVRLLAAWTDTGAAGAPPSFADRLGDWLGWTHAIALSAIALSAMAPADGARARTGPASASTLASLKRARQQLVADLAAQAPPGADGGEGFAPLRQHYQQRQRAMEAGVGALRAQARTALAGAGSRLRELAALDAVFDEALLGRERSLLATVPALLQRRFERLQHAGAADDAQARLRRDLEAVLRAELEVRLQPVDGLIQALDECAGEAAAARTAGVPT